MRASGKRQVHALFAVVLALAGMAGCASDGSNESSPAPSSTEATTTTTTIPGMRPSSGCGEPGDAAGPTTTTVVPLATTIAGEQRSAVISAEGVSSERPSPVVVLLHGMGQNAQVIDTNSDFPAQAEKSGVIVITPNAVGSPTMWRPSGDGPDADYISWLIDEVSGAYCVDESRVYLAGFSVGAAMATAYACAHQDRIAAVATVAVQFPGSCEQPMPIIGFHGSADPIVPFAAGAEGAVGGGAGTLANMATWAQVAGCDAEPVESEAAAKVTEFDWPNCDNGAEVRLYRVDGGVHAWPGTPGGGDAVPPEQSVDATALSLSFFARHHS
ncbi:MAG: alpha/beta hydrolase fold domain-containing protein [Acidimicrobiales bacterium]|nr:alpha/beta hydrolase fold domain-containing protein [Acidimicrobiales bacterium]